MNQNCKSEATVKINKYAKKGETNTDFDCDLFDSK